MPVFRYNAIDHQGEKREGELEAAGHDDVAGYLNQKGLLLLSLSEVKEKTALQKVKLFSGSFTLIDRQILFEDLATMVSAGLPIADAIKILREDAEKKILQEVLMDFQFTIEKGELLSSAMEHYPQFFSPVVTNLIKAGESSGNLERTLHVIATQYRKENDLKRRVVGAMVYPIILTVLSVTVVIFLLIFVVPKLSQFFSQASLTLPFMTRVVVNLGNLMSRSFILDGLVLLALAAFFIFLAKTEKGRALFFSFIAKLPFTGKLYRQLAVYRYCWTMGILIASGVGILEGIQITKDVLPGKNYKDALERLKDKISTGTSLGTAIKEESKLFPQIVSGLTTVGEKTGNLQEIYVSLAKFYERNFAAALKGLVTMIEPLLLMVMGGVVGSIALAIVLPIYQFVSGVT